MKAKYLLIIIALLMMAGCHNKTSQEKSGKDSVMNISEVGIADTAIIVDDENILHAKMMYYDFDQIENLVTFFDSILVKHPIPIWLPEEEYTTQKTKECIAR